jgi:hypothetical protein
VGGVLRTNASSSTRHGIRRPPSPLGDLHDGSSGALLLGTLPSSPCLSHLPPSVTGAGFFVVVVVGGGGGDGNALAPSMARRLAWGMWWWWWRRWWRE